MPVPPSPDPNRRQTLREEVADRVRTAIFDGIFAPGEVLHDRELQEWLGVSRQPIREALHDLVRVGLVEMAPQRWTRVALPDPRGREAIVQALGTLVRGVVGVTLPSLTAQDKRILDAQIRRIISAVKIRDAARHHSSAREFVRSLIAMCPNDVLVQATRESIDSLTYKLAATTPDGGDDWRSLGAAYSSLRDSLRTDDAIGAERATEAVFRLHDLGAPGGER